MPLQALILILLLGLPVEKEAETVKITAYTARVQETDSTPFETSFGRVKEGGIALSRDLEKKYKLKEGDRIYLDCFTDKRYSGIYSFNDRMHKRKKNQVDIFMLSLKKAKRVGIKNRAKLYIYKRRKRG